MKKSGEAPAVAPEPTLISVNALIASSLGLNKIKTRSGPLPQESFFSFGREKGVALGASNLSKKKEKPFEENAENGSNSDSVSTGSGASRDQSPHVIQARSRLQNEESSSGATGTHLFNQCIYVIKIMLLQLIIGQGRNGELC